MNNLRIHLLTNVLASDFNINKYSICFNNLNAVISLEREDNKNPLSNSLFKEFDDIKSDMDNLLKKKINVPLLILEQYYFRNNNNLSKEIYIQFKNLGFEILVSELYLVLEQFYNKIFLVCVKISDYYNLEIKMKTNNETETKYL